MRPTAAFACALIAASTLVAGCADWKPAKVLIEPLPDPIFDKNPVAMRARALNAKDEPLEKQSLSFAVAPEEVAEIASGGALRCLRTGDAQLTVTGGPAVANLTVRCRIPTEVAMPAAIRLIAGDPPQTIGARALGEGGRVMEDVRVPLSSSDEAVLRIEEGRAAPVAIGRAQIRATMGVVQAVAAAEVVDRIVAGPLVLEEGKATTLRLDPGTYEVAIDAKPAVRAPQGVTVSWDGVRCPAQLEAQTHRLTCVVHEAATLTVKNPVSYGLGARVSGTLSVYRVPPS
ncbi:MAG: hypothetical protein ACRD5D_09610 [Candidatus Polarisedimenticolia bacterium]